MKEIDSEVVCHGSTHEQAKQDSLQAKYPVSLCPECTVGETKVIERIKDESSGWTSYWLTGRESDASTILFDRQGRIVCYKCLTCGCQWYKKYLIKETKWVLKELFWKILIYLFGFIVSILAIVYGCHLIETIESCQSITSIFVEAFSICGGVVGIIVFGALFYDSF